MTMRGILISPTDLTDIARIDFTPKIIKYYRKLRKIVLYNDVLLVYMRNFY